MYNDGVVVTKRLRVVGDLTRARLPQHRAAAAVRLTDTPDANGADGGYYPDNVDPYQPVETYGARGQGAG